MVSHHADAGCRANGARVSVTTRCRPLFLGAMLCLVACRENQDEHIGGDWYVRSLPADAHRKAAAHKDLVRRWNGVDVQAASFIGPRYRFYAPDCAMYEWPPFGTASAQNREVYFVCGDHWPARVAFMSRHGARMDPDGLRPEPGVEMRPNSGIIGAIGDDAPRDFMAVADMRAAAEKEPQNRRGIEPALTRANHIVLGIVFAVALGVVAMMRLHRRRP